MLVISRHPGCVQWLKDNGVEIDAVITHATAEDVTGKNVIGHLPLHLAALTASVSVVDLPYLPAEFRGTDLTPEQMDAFGAVLNAYDVLKL